jgi:hypothetical protein
MRDLTIILAAAGSINTGNKTTAMALPSFIFALQNQRLDNISSSSWFNKYREQNNRHGLTIHFCPSK